MHLPMIWAPAIAVSAGGRTWSPQIGASAQGTATADGRVILAPLERQDGWLVPFIGPREKYPMEARFAGDNWSVRLTDIAFRPAVAPGRDLSVMLRWAPEMGATTRDYRVFVHLRDAAGDTVATGDATPTWFAQLPTHRWPGGQAVWGAHAVAIPADLAPGEYKLVIGWYDPQSGKRLGSISGNANGNEFVLGRVAVKPLAGPRPDLACLMAPAACLSQE
jgi:hypothetical protein